MIVYLERAIQAFVMYCVNGTSSSSLLIESNDSMIPDEFTAQSQVNIHRLTLKGRSNIMVQLARALGTMRPDVVDSVIPIRRMPVGLRVCCQLFFTSKKVLVHVCVHLLTSVTVMLFQQVVPCPEDYKSWWETMYCLFGTKWSKYSQWSNVVSRSNCLRWLQYISTLFTEPSRCMFLYIVHRVHVHAHFHSLLRQGYMF